MKLVDKIKSVLSGANRLGKSMVPFITTLGIILSIVVAVLQFPSLWQDFFKKFSSSQTPKVESFCKDVFKDSSNYRILVLPFFKTCETGRDVGLEIKNRLEILKYKDSLSIEICYLDTFKQNPNFTKEQADRMRKENNADQIIYGVNSSVNCTPQDTLLEVCVNYLVDENYMVNTAVPISQVKASVSEIRQGFLQANIDYIVYYFSAVSDYNKGKYKQSLYKLSKITNRDNNGSYNYLKGSVFERLNNADSALFNYNLAIKSNFQPTYLLARASIYRMEFSEFKLSLNDCMSAIKITKDTSLITQALFDISFNKYLLDDFKGSLSAIDMYISYEKRPDSSDFSKLYLLKGLNFTSLGKKDSALIYTNKSIAFNQNFLLAIRTRAELLANNYEYDMALIDYNFLIKNDSKNDEYYIARADIYYKKGNADKSNEDYKKAINISANLVDTYLKIAQARRDQYDSWESLYLLNYILKGHENSFAIHHHLGVTYSVLHNNIEAIKHYEISMRLRPSYEINFFNVSTVYYEVGRYKDALREINKYLKLNPVDGKSYYWRGLIKIALSDTSSTTDMKKAAQHGNPLAKDYLGNK